MSSLRDASSTSLPLLPPLLGQALRPLPLLPLQIALGAVLRGILRRHPQLFDRLGSHRGKRFGIKPTDLPFAFVIQAGPGRPRLAAVRELPTDVDASISASIVNLLALVEGRLDGDALMFARQLVIEGDIESVLALRNAIDDAGLDLVGEIAGLAGPFGEPAQRLLAAARDSLLKSTTNESGMRRWS
ncbi:ubiquinone anaerobic biosynthesis accessory factor UbiT [Bradyrhizobium oligotrophicum]